MGKNTNMEEEAQYDAHGFATVHNDGKFYLIFNDEVVGEYDSVEELKAAHEHVINKIKLPEDESHQEQASTDESKKPSIEEQNQMNRKVYPEQVLASLIIKGVGKIRDKLSDIEGSWKAAKKNGKVIQNDSNKKNTHDH